MILPSLVALNQIKHEEPYLYSKRGNRFYYVFSSTTLHSPIILGLMDLVEIVFSSAMLLAYFVQRDAFCFSGDEILYYYVPIVCFLSYFAFLRFFAMFYLFVYRARRGFARNTRITRALDRMAGRGEMEIY
jgi:hypothetical protein